MKNNNNGENLKKLASNKTSIKNNATTNPFSPFLPSLFPSPPFPPPFLLPLNTKNQKAQKHTESVAQRG